MLKYNRGNEVLPWLSPKPLIKLMTSVIFDCRLIGFLLVCDKIGEMYMLLSLALIFLCGMVLGKVFERLKLPKLLGMLSTGILLGPYVLNLLDRAILDISTDLRQIALIIILTRAGLNLDIKDLKKVGRPAILMCFVPACFGILLVTIVHVITGVIGFSGLLAGHLGHLFGKRNTRFQNVFHKSSLSYGLEQKCFFLFS